MSTSISVSHHFETAHRLPQLGGKCTNLHGHTWHTEITVTGQPDSDGILVDFGQLKHTLRGWIDTHLDHGTMLGANDPLVDPLDQAGCKVFVFGKHQPTEGLGWPTVENTAELLHRVTTSILASHQWHQLTLTRVLVTETQTNSATVNP